MKYAGIVFTVASALLIQNSSALPLNLDTATLAEVYPDKVTLDEVTTAKEAEATGVNWCYKFISNLCPDAMVQKEIEKKCGKILGSKISNVSRDDIDKLIAAGIFDFKFVSKIDFTKKEDEDHVCQQITKEQRDNLPNTVKIRFNTECGFTGVCQKPNTPAPKKTNNPAAKPPPKNATDSGPLNSSPNSGGGSPPPPPGGPPPPPPPPGVRPPPPPPSSTTKKTVASKKLDDCTSLNIGKFLSLENVNSSTQYDGSDNHWCAKLGVSLRSAAPEVLEAIYVKCPHLRPSPKPSSVDKSDNSTPTPTPSPPSVTKQSEESAKDEKSEEPNGHSEDQTEHSEDPKDPKDKKKSTKGAKKRSEEDKDPNNLTGLRNLTLPEEIKVLVEGDLSSENLETLKQIMENAPAYTAESGERSNHWCFILDDKATKEKVSKADADLMKLVAKKCDDHSPNGHKKNSATMVGAGFGSVAIALVASCFI